ncbi:ATPase [Flavobacterium alvei]|uniref:ATPase n=1 Tax=Flavobacterium alvei TaxID=2080416 RepID=A0A2S5ACT7_9FLAO|nr:ATP-binding protein [Flavobacterium alvei]POY40129.1 ATPase [Flavobacterium alvei]HQE34635.1 ATP-binding protein [Flavobacterium alvei]HQK39087.1 ATP-binding protein [Flavobacterium alvei]
MEIDRLALDLILQKLQPNKVIVLLGARRVGKTELIKKLVEQLNEKVLFLNGDDIESHSLLEIQSTANFKRLLGDTKFLIIDEAQEIPAIGKKLKLMVDTIQDLKILVTGSSAFEINNQLGEPLVGRMKTINLYPIAQMEYAKNENLLQTRSNLEDRLILGSYPELSHITNREEKISYLKELVNTQLLRDIFAFEGIKKRDKIIALLQIIAFRTGSELSLESVGRDLQISKNTVEKYLDLFSKVFIIYSVSGFSRNRDNEITKMKKWYFVDNGIRNAIINTFNPLNSREDVGKLWENYLNSERMKKMSYTQNFVYDYFWRTHTKQEIDRIEEKNEQLAAFEYKYGKAKAKIPTEFAKSYPEATFEIINQDNYLDYIL